ncbi:septal ring lytic transglycosylase RlpA family protein [Alteromonas sp. 5E99-2]|uniref:septal ring lytic transglycosylase RlpA family protein n=1 Tax=Alteromonas sp. 5E99-2 TaxID=2817683 RepID=UPI00241870C5|nr:septal ring lytic transglycosylase RlpA family protein [Alteromonas sp. 5E99-2]
MLVMSCAQQPTGRYSQVNDSAPPTQNIQVQQNDATPRYEPYRSHNFNSYTVHGKTYHPLKTGKGFTQQGNASWYGQKFHGHLTSNGETYDMFAMSAAHKTLPLPSYVKVTNTENNKTVIVRVNDRGPFHDSRIIDLSYAAAKKIDSLKHGTAHVKLEVIHVTKDDLYTVGDGPTLSFSEYIGISPVKQEFQPNDSANQGSFIQVAALSDEAALTTLSNVLSTLYHVPFLILPSNTLYKLQLGPIADQHQLAQLLTDLRSNGYPSAFVVK